MKKLFFLLLAYFSLTQFQCPGEEFTDGDDFSRLSYALAVQGGQLYLANTANIRSFNLTDPLFPALTGMTTVEQDLLQLHLAPGFALVTGRVFSTAFPLDANGIPQTGSLTGLFDGCLPVASNATHFFSLENITTGCRNPSFIQGSSLRIIPALNPLPIENENLIRTLPMENPQDVAVEGNLLFVADGTSGLKVFSIANPGNIQLVSHRTDLVANKVQVAENRLTVMSADRVFVFDYANPAELELLAEMPF